MNQDALTAKERELELREQLVKKTEEVVHYRTLYADAIEENLSWREKAEKQKISSKDGYLLSRMKSSRCTELLMEKGAFYEKLYHRELMEELNFSLRKEGFLEMAQYDTLERMLVPTLARIRNWEPDGRMTAWIEEREKKRLATQSKPQKEPKKPTYYVGIDCPIDTF